ncbi:TonB-dependent receptor domain-containing protein [Novosphingobium sediminicola]|uniref:Outer membrane receptor protein involved in Fe transport n=1 Tax=Novosphingobium sediminicola TaxID=563162 RepID=A0A7W6CJK8_9SPHN|nr:TonB-dependent receptor [Novosphingobium sediminicola]MBB3957736.1 outer membrane receptor protein involved in Fe transport [Novosphingobium sediminicola]
MISKRAMSMGASLFALGLGCGFGATEAMAQEQAAPNAVTAADIVVTGSRLRTTTFSTPTPVTALTSAALESASPGNLAEGLKQLPSVVPTGGQTAGGGTRAGGQNFLNLRGLGILRSLTLLDGRRFVPADPRLVTDVNLIPQMLVDRVDVVTGGASATYGSDAVGGVVNFVLNRKLEGMRYTVSEGISQRGDNQEFKASLAYGTKLGGIGHLILGGEYYDGTGVNGDARDFRTTAPNLLRNPSGAPTLVTGTDIRTPYTLGGLIVNGTGGTSANNALIRGMKFAPDGTLSAYNYGTLATDVGVTSGTQNGGDGYRVSTGQEIVRPLKRRSLFAHADFELTNSINLFVEGTYGWTISNFQSSPTTTTLSIARSNPYLAQVAPALVTQMTSLGVTGFTMNRLTMEAGPTYTGNENTALRGLIGLEGKLGGFKWDVSYQYGRTDNHSPTYNNLITANMARAVNTTRDSSGAIVCADTLSTNAATRAAAAGCVPLNPFGAGAPSAAAMSYVMGTSVFDTRSEMQVADANISGDLFNLPAGPVGMALGAEWRSAKATTTADPLSQAGAYRLVNQQNFFGQYNVKEVYGELNIPLLIDKPFFHRLSASLAGRHTEYSTSGGVNTWKAGLNWQISNDLKLRGTISRDIRAPNLEDLYASGRQNNLTITDTLTNRTYTAVPNQTYGNTALRPEKAITKVLGLIYQPSWLNGFNIAVDYYDIKISDSISNIGGQTAVDQCNLTNQASPLCSFVTRDATNAVIATRTSPINFSSQQTNGVDIEAQYRTTLRNEARLGFRLLASYVAHNRTLSPLITNPVDDAGNMITQSSGVAQPHWRGNLIANYDSDHVSVMLQGRYIGGMIWDKTKVVGVDTDFGSVGAQFYLDGEISTKFRTFGGEQTLFLNVQNILDHQPPFAPIITGATPLPTQPDLYDQVGRMFRVGIRGKF